MRYLLLAAFGIAAVSAPPPAPAIQITPTVLAIAHGDSSTSFTLRNTSTAVISLDLHAFGWHNDLSGEIKLDPTDDLIVFPTHIALGAGEERRVRVGTRVGVQTQERSYRLIVEQTSPTPAQESGSTIALRLRFSVPLFIQPVNRRATINLLPPTISNGEVHVRLTNDSGIHVTPNRIEVSGKNASGTVIWTKTLHAWYLLAGESRDEAAALTPAECRQTATMDSQATFAENATLTLRQSGPVARGACGQMP